jgi:hypothetical protein
MFERTHGQKSFGISFARNRDKLKNRCSKLGMIVRSQTHSDNLARESWQQAADLYATLGTNGSQPDTAEYALLLILAGDTYGRLAEGTSSDPVPMPTRAASNSPTPGWRSAGPS